VLEPRSNTMKMGVHKETLLPSLKDADCAFVYMPEDVDWAMDLTAFPNVKVFTEMAVLTDAVIQTAKMGDHVLFMSNGSFGGIHQAVENGLS